MSTEQAIKYLKNVLAKWTAFCGTHIKITEAIRVLISEIEGVED